MNKYLATSSKSIPKPQNEQLCFAFLKGKCKQKSCAKRHPSKERIPELVEKFKKSQCNGGSRCKMECCPYDHSINDDADSQTSKNELEIDNNDTSDLEIDNDVTYDLQSTNSKQSIDEFDSDIINVFKKLETLSDRYDESFQIIMEFLLDSTIKKIDVPHIIAQSILNQPAPNNHESLKFWNIFFSMNSRKNHPFNTFDARFQKVEDIKFVVWDILIYSRTKSLEYIWIITEKSISKNVMYNALFKYKINFMMSTNHPLLNGYWIRLESN